MVAYDYVFYRLYRLAENSPSKLWPSEFKAYVTLSVIEVWFLLSIYLYLTHDNDHWNSHGTVAVVAIVCVIFIGNYLIYEWKNRWKRLVKKFESWPNQRNRLGDLLVWSFPIGMIAWVVVCFTVLLKQP